MLQILDTLMLLLFVLFLVYIFRGYHLSKREQDAKDTTEIDPSDTSRGES